MKLTKGYYKSNGYRTKYWKLNNCICDLDINKEDEKVIGNEILFSKVFEEFTGPIYNATWDSGEKIYYICENGDFNRLDKLEIKKCLHAHKFNDKFEEMLK